MIFLPDVMYLEVILFPINTTNIYAARSTSMPLIHPVTETYSRRRSMMAFLTIYEATS
jgi:hypothetical protein